MRPIGPLKLEAHARTFGDYLFTRGIPNQVEPADDGTWTIWIEPEERLDEARGLLAHFLQQPDATEYHRHTGAAETIRGEEARANEAWRRRVFSRQQLRQSFAPYGPGALTLLLMALSVFVSFVGKFGENQSFLESFYIDWPGDGGGFLNDVRHGQVWRLITPIFMHFSIMHLVGNMMLLFILGSMIEARQGTGRLLLLVVAFGLASNFAQYLAQYRTNGPFFGGFSGVGYGLFGYVWLRGKLDPTSGLFVSAQNVVLMLVWFVLCFTGSIGPIANTAHTTGLVLGALWGWLSSKRRT